MIDQGSAKEVVEKSSEQEWKNANKLGVFEVGCIFVGHPKLPFLIKTADLLKSDSRLDAFWSFPSESVTAT